MSGEEHESLQELMERVEELEKEKAKRDKEEVEKGRAFHTNLTVAVGTIGGIAFAALVLIIESKKIFTVSTDVFLSPRDSFVGLVVLLALTCEFSAFSVIFTSLAGSGISKPTGPVGMTGFFLGMISIGAFILSIVLVVAAITSKGSIIVAGGVAAIVCVSYFALRRESR